MPKADSRRFSSPETLPMYLPATSRIILLSASISVCIVPAYTIYAEDLTAIDSIVSIEQTLNLFARSVDTHDYALLDLIFTPDATANFAPSTGYVDGLPAIKTELQNVLTGTVSQHALSTHMINVTSNQTMKASASTYVQGTFFGKGNLTGQIQTTYGRSVCRFEDC